MLKRICNLLIVLVCVAAAQLCTAQPEVHTIKNVNQFNKLMADLTADMREEVFVKLVGKLSSVPLKKLIPRSFFFDYSRKYRFKEIDGIYFLQFEMIDSSRMLAAYRNPRFRARLSAEEKAALDEAEARIQPFRNSGKKRIAIVKALHDDLVKRVTYNRNVGEGCTTIFLKNQGLCDGYSRSMYLMLNMLDIPCHIVVGHAKEPHAWNIVQLEHGEWYHVDATWDDPTTEDNSHKVIYNYFCLSDAEMRADHRWNRKSYPETPRKLAVYYHAFGLYFSDYEKFWKAVQKSYDRGDFDFQAYLTCYKNRKTFLASMNEYRAGGGSADLEGMIPPAKKSGPLHLSFHRPKAGKYTPPPRVPRVDTTTRPVEKNPGWLDNELWKDLSEMIDMDTVMKEGSKLLLEGIHAAEEAAESFDGEELRKKGMKAYNELLKLL